MCSLPLCARVERGGGFCASALAGPCEAYRFVRLAVFWHRVPPQEPSRVRPHQAKFAILDYVLAAGKKYRTVCVSASALFGQKKENGVSGICFGDTAYGTSCQLRCRYTSGGRASCDSPERDPGAATGSDDDEDDVRFGVLKAS